MIFNDDTLNGVNTVRRSQNIRKKDPVIILLNKESLCKLYNMKLVNIKYDFAFPSCGRRDKRNVIPLL